MKTRSRITVLVGDVSDRVLVGTADHALKTSPGKGGCFNSGFIYAQFVKERAEEHRGVAFRVKLFGPGGNLVT